jgi:hypothetical protein
MKLWKRVALVYLIDCAAVAGFGIAIGSAYGGWWGLAAVLAVIAYGIACFVDGTTR